MATLYFTIFVHFLLFVSLPAGRLISHSAVDSCILNPKTVFLDKKPLSLLCRHRLQPTHSGNVWSSTATCLFIILSANISIFIYWPNTKLADTAQVALVSNYGRRYILEIARRQFIFCLKLYFASATLYPIHTESNN